MSKHPTPAALGAVRQVRFEDAVFWRQQAKLLADAPSGERAFVRKLLPDLSKQLSTDPQIAAQESRDRASAALGALLQTALIERVLSAPYRGLRTTPSGAST